ncbi:MAG: DegV family EDD domain-containing protein [Lachnospiraceae bacterium]|nr:DegV family EDD domain-containing protein [Lachnospiraceae bacterium]
MRLSFSDFLGYFFHEKDTDGLRDTVNRYVYSSTMGKMRLVAAFLAVTEIFALILSFGKKHAQSPYVMSYRLIYLSMLIIMLINLIILAAARRDPDRRYVWLSWTLPVTAAAILAWAMAATVVNARALSTADPALYIAASLALPCCIFMNPAVFLFIMMVSDGVMLIVFSGLAHNTGSPGPQIAMIALICLLRTTIGLMLHFVQFYIRVNSIYYEKQQKEISDLNNAQNRFFSSMSHEIRTPINTIIGLNEAILREDISDEVAEDAANIRASSNMLLHLINDILDMSKISSGQMKLMLAPYHPGSMLSDLVSMLWLRTREKGLDFHIEIAPDIPSELNGDEVRIKQILINVLNNAIKYTDEGSITLSIQCTGINDGKADIVYTVTDTGIGIKKENIPHLFTAFRRVDEEQNKYIEGTGLGLSIVKELVELMGGSVSVNSVYTQGSTFIIEIPQTVTDFTEIGNIQFEEKHRMNLSGNYHCTFEAPQANVLVVDDTPSNLLVIKKLLRDTKMTIDTASGGEEALDMTLEKEYNIILMDHVMPNMDGIECFHRIRSQTGGLSKEAKVIALTANAGNDMQEMYYNEGFDGYLVKPVNSSHLERELARLLPDDLKIITRNDEDIIENSVRWMDSHRRKKPVAISSESIADIPKSLLEEYGIEVILHKVITEEGVFTDTAEIDSDELLDYMKEGHTIRTQAPSVKECEDFFAKVLSGANSVLHMNISAHVNNSGITDAEEGARAFTNVTVFDTRHLSSGEGLVTLEACALAESGMSVGEIIRELENVRNRINTSFIVDNFDYLAKSGQTSTRLAAIGKAVMFHPVLAMKNGRLKLSSFYLGSKSHAWSRYISRTLSNVSAIDRSILFITYVGLTQKDLDWIMALVEKKVHFEKVYCQKASPTIAVNAGPGTFGLLFKKI